MRYTRVIAIGVILGSVALTALNAQTLRDARPPSEFPPLSYKGKQFVDSRGCIYIRAGIDGNVTWVPRVSRSRKQICGYKPTAVTGATVSPPAQRPAKAPTIITLAPADRPKQAAPVPPKTAAKAPARPAPTVAAAAKPTVAAAAKPTVAATAKPVTSRPAKAPSPGPAPTVFHNPAAKRPPAASPAPAAPIRTVRAQPTYVPSPGPQPTVFTNPPPAKKTPNKTMAAPVLAPRKTRAAPQSGAACANASTFSQQFINKGARCGPQAEPPVSYKTGVASRPVHLSPNTVVVTKHVYENRQNTTNVSVPPGYRAVWKDDRLNPRRTEHTLRPTAIRAAAVVPAGYKRVDRGDDRYNTARAGGTASGEAQTDMIWTRTIPRRLVKVSARGPVARAKTTAMVSPAEARPAVLRLSSRSAPDAGGVVWTTSGPVETR